MSKPFIKERKVTLQQGINYVIYTDTNEEVPDHVDLYLPTGKGIGNLKQIREAGVKNGTLGTHTVWSGKTYHEDDEPVGTVQTLKNALYVKELPGGARKSLRKRKSKKSRKGKSKKNRRKSNRRR